MHLVHSRHEVYLPAIDCRWDLHFYLGASRIQIKEYFEHVDIYLRDACPHARLTAIQRWLKRKATLEMSPWLRRVSRDCQLPFHSVQFRGQKRRWGSCTRDGRISLNYHLLFLPADHVQYVLIHELCHTVHFNHSAEFWQLVASFLPNWQVLRKSVRYADNYLPSWLKL